MREHRQRWTDGGHRQEGGRGARAGRQRQGGEEEGGAATEKEKSSEQRGRAARTSTAAGRLRRGGEDRDKGRHQTATYFPSTADGTKTRYGSTTQPLSNLPLVLWSAS